MILTRRWAVALAAVLLLGGCGGSGSHRSTARGPAAPSDAQVRAVVDGFLYDVGNPARACREAWAPVWQAGCIRTARHLKATLARPAFALPKRGRLPYRLASVSPTMVSGEVGNRNPYPGSGPLFYGQFVLKRYGSAWKFVSFEGASFGSP